MAYDVPFQNIPQNLRIPLFFAELNNSNANTNQQNQRGLIIGQLLQSGSATPGQPVLCGGTSGAIALCGAGSMLALMAAAYFNADPFGETWLLPLADPSNGAAATGAFSFTGPATANGVLSTYIGGQRVQVPVTTGLTAVQTASAVAAAINAVSSLPVTATIDGANAFKVDLTAKNAGVIGNEIDLRFNYLGARGGEATPPGLAVTITAMNGGTLTPSLTTGLANLTDKPFDFIVNPYVDTVSGAAIGSFLSDTAGRWSWQSQVYGHSFGAYRGTYGSLATYGAGLNDQHQTSMGFFDSPDPYWIWAADVAGTAAVSLRADPARPLQTLKLSTVHSPPVPSEFTSGERNTLLYDGISTFTVNQDRSVSIENLITTYQKNAGGQPDDSYLQVETMFTLMAVLRNLKSAVVSTFGRMKLVENGTRIPAGSNFCTPNSIRAFLISQYQAMSPGLVQDVEAFAAGLVVQQNSQNPSRVDVLYDPVLTGGLRTLALLAQFQLIAPAPAAAQ